MTTSNEEILKSAREKLYKTKNVQTFGDLNLLWFDLDQEPNYEQVFKRMREIKFKPHDVISVGFPRSGNHWVFEILNMVLHQKVDFAKEMMFPHSFDTMTTQYEVPKSEEHPNIYTGHFTLNMLPKDFLEKGVKVVYILRNPKDAILSSYSLFSLYKDLRLRLDMSWDEFFELELTGEVPYGSWFNHVLKTEAFMKEHPTCQVFVMQYEKLKEDPVKEIRELCEFLGKPTELVDQIAKVTSFSNMKEGTKEKMSELEKPVFRDGWSVLSKGKVSEWKKKFTVAQSERFNEHFEKVCKDSPLANRMREYIM